VPRLLSEGRSSILPRWIHDGLRAELRTISVPTLIIHGDRDVQAPIDICGRKTAQLVPGNRFVVYDNAAHGLFVTHADRLNADLLAFRAKHCHAS
jgi:non-heme chloroperoxidase